MTPDALIRALPKVELHVHIEGTLEPELMLDLAARNAIELPYDTEDEVREAYRFEDLESFLALYYQGARVLVTERDFYDLTRQYLERVTREGVRHAEIMFDPQTHTARGIPFETVITGISAALQDAEATLNVTSRLIMCFLRDRSVEEAMDTLREALAFREMITAVGLDSAEQDHPPEKFVDVFDQAKARGFLAVAHAGEEGPPEYIRQALELLNVQRIDHGVRCSGDPGLVAELARRQIPLTVCPLSNVKLGVFERLEDHNLKQLLDAGVCITINSDDPAYFGGYITENFLETQRALDLTEDDLQRLASNAVVASFLEPERKQELLGEIEATVGG